MAGRVRLPRLHSIEIKMTKEKTILPEVEKYIRDNMKTKTIKAIAAELGLSRTMTYNMVVQLGITDRVKKPYHYPKDNFEKPKMKRHPAVYSNISREQHVDKWLNVNID